MFRLEKYQQKQYGKLRPWETCRRRDHPGGILGAPTLGLLGDDSQWGLRSSVSDIERECRGWPLTAGEETVSRKTEEPPKSSSGLTRESAA